MFLCLCAYFPHNANFCVQREFRLFSGPFLRFPLPMVPLLLHPHSSQMSIDFAFQVTWGSWMNNEENLLSRQNSTPQSTHNASLSLQSYFTTMHVSECMIPLIWKILLLDWCLLFCISCKNAAFNDCPCCSLYSCIFIRTNIQWFKPISSISMGVNKLWIRRVGSNVTRKLQRSFKGMFQTCICFLKCYSFF